MVRDVYFELVDKATRLPLPDTSVDAVTDLPDHASVIRFRDAVLRECPNTLAYVDATNLRVYANRAAYDEENAQPLDPRSSLNSLDTQATLIVEVPTQHRVPRTLATEPTEISVVIEEVRSNEELWQELVYYQQRGRLIQEHCKAYCDQILDKIDELYRENSDPLPFICVEGSSGMGKSQLAFALGGRRPWFYWLATSVGSQSQRVYRNFGSLSGAFHSFVDKDNPRGKSQDDILNSTSRTYRNDQLWTYGFICALLEYCTSEEHQSAQQMIRFDNATRLVVKPCDLKSVRAVIDKMKAMEKTLPFFVLDEMDVKSGGVNTAAFQRNVFRACGLVVIIMGTDSKITNFLSQVKGSYGIRHKWMALVPRFPRYQLMLYTSEENRMWPRLVTKHTILQDILTRSRGRFARYFMERVVECAIQSSEVKLPHLLDEAFARVSLRTHEGKAFLRSKEGRFAQFMAISHTNVVVAKEDEVEPPRKKTRLEIGTSGMHLHFANLIDDKLRDMIASDQALETDAGPWQPTCCFPAINEDVLLYLAILGGKAFPSYYDHNSRKQYSTKYIFAETKVFSVHENANAVSHDYKSFENMVAHAIFSSSRRNGVQGILFDDFLACLLGELRGELWNKVEMRCRYTGKSMSSSDLFEGYARDVTNVSSRIIPFLAPPNAEWPPFIIDSNRHGCRFGHLVRAYNEERCDVYVQDVEVENEKAIFLCECKYWNKSVDMSAMRAIVRGLNQKWQWEVVLLFCTRLVRLHLEWEEPDIGCVKVSYQDGGVEWVFQPQLGNRKRLIIVVETLASGQ